MAEENYDIEEILFGGGVDSDNSLKDIRPGDFLYALNIINNSSGVGNKGIVTFPNGTMQVPFNLPVGKNKCIGVAEDNENDRFVFFNWNENNNHGIYRFDAKTRSVVPLLLNLVQTNNVDILRFSKDFLILHADILRRNLLYWVDGKENARKTNIEKLLDTSETGYGGTILQSFIDAYKQTAAYPPTVVYFSDTTKQFNRLYGALRRFAVRFIYDDGEQSNWSDFSAIALPDKEPFTGFKTIPTNNNGLRITFGTGNRLVVRIEIAMQSTSDELNNEGIINWKLIATLDKKVLSIPDDSFYTYQFYNDSVYPTTPYEKIIRPNNFLPKKPLCQTAAKNKLVYSNFFEGFEGVPIDVSATVEYNDLFIESGVENKFNEPFFSITPITGEADYLSQGEEYTKLDGSTAFVPIRQTRRANAFEVKIGADVKFGNKFNIRLYSNKENYPLSYTAKLSDNSQTVAQSIINLLISTGAIILKTPEVNQYRIYDLNNDGDNNITFKFVAITQVNDSSYYSATASVNPVEYSSLKDTGESKRNIKLGSVIKYGIIYEDDPDQRKTATYTNDALIVTFKTINQLVKDDGKTMFQSPVVSLEIKHRPPKWAKYYQIVRSNDLIYKNYIQILIQKAITIQGTNNDEYVDLVVGSLATYNKIHSNSNLSYNFTKGDRIRLINKLDTSEYYDFFETEILQYLPVVNEKQTSNLITNGSDEVEVKFASAENIGRYISFQENERLIIDVIGSNKYKLDATVGSTESTTYLSYDLIDRRGVVRIRKPAIDISDNSLVEIFTPSASDLSLVDKQFFEFQKKFPIINAGTENAYHGGNAQNQDNVLPAIVRISEGTAYVRNRELPINNSYPGAQVEISIIEDPQFSDFYPSLINDNGRPNIEDNGVGEVHFIDRMRFSNNSIEETKLNGLGDFDNLDREDYTDKYGGIVRTVFYNNDILLFKKLRTAYIPLDSRITIDDAGTFLRAGSANFLNPIQYYALEGGIGENPESYCSEGTHRYFMSANAGVLVRLGFNGEEPISKTFFFNKEIKEVLQKAAINKAKIYLAFNRKLSLLCITIEGYNEYIYYDGFNGWKLTKDSILSTDTLEIVELPDNGTVVIDANNQFLYTPNNGYTGADHFSWRAYNNGQWTEPERVCLKGKKLPNRQTSWRGQLPVTCTLTEEGLHDGKASFTILEEYYIDDNSNTGNVKPNIDSDPDYIAPFYDSNSCIPAEWAIDEDRSYCEEVQQVFESSVIKSVTRSSSMGDSVVTMDNSNVVRNEIAGVSIITLNTLGDPKIFTAPANGSYDIQVSFSGASSATANAGFFAEFKFYLEINGVKHALAPNTTNPVSGNTCQFYFVSPATSGVRTGSVSFNGAYSNNNVNLLIGQTVKLYIEVYTSITGASSIPLNINVNPCNVLIKRN